MVVVVVVVERFMLEELECWAVVVLLSKEEAVLLWLCRCESEVWEDELCWRGRPISGPALEEVRRVRLLVTCVARLNMLGIRVRLNVDALPPSGEWICWYVSNSPRRVLRILRKSYAAVALTAAEAAELFCG